MSHKSRVWSRNFVLGCLGCRYRLASVLSLCGKTSASVVSFESDRDVTSQDHTMLDALAVQLNGDLSLRNWLRIDHRSAW